MDTPAWWDRFHNNFYRNQEWYLESDELLPFILLIFESLWYNPLSRIEQTNDTSTTTIISTNNDKYHNDVNAALPISAFRILHIGCGTSSLGKALRMVWPQWYNQQIIASLSTKNIVENNTSNVPITTNSLDTTTIIPSIEIINIDFSQICIDYQKEYDPEGIYLTMDATKLPLSILTNDKHIDSELFVDSSNHPSKELLSSSSVTNYFSNPFHVILDKGTIDAILATRNEHTLSIAYNLLITNLCSLFTYSYDNYHHSYYINKPSNNNPLIPTFIIISMIGTIERYNDIEEGIYQFEQKYLVNNNKNNSTASIEITNKPIPITKDNSIQVHDNNDVVNHDKQLSTSSSITTDTIDNITVSSSHSSKLQYFTLFRKDTGIPPLENPEQLSSYLYVIQFKDAN